LISVQNVAAAKRKVVADFLNSYLSAVWHRSNRIEKGFLRTLAQGKPTDNSSRAQIRRLLDWKIVSEEEGKYSFSGDLLKEWTLMAMGEIKFWEATFISRPPISGNNNTHIMTHFLER